MVSGLIFLSASLSASEIALFSLSRFQLRSLKENFRPIYLKIKQLLNDPSGLLLTILIVNECINISISTLITQRVSQKHWEIPTILQFMPQWVFELMTTLLITTFLVLFLCELTPKVIGARMNQLIATSTVNPLTMIYILFTPIRFLLRWILRISIFRQASKTFNHQIDTTLQESEFLLMLEEGQKEGAIQESEFELIQNVFELDRTTVAEIATPFSEILSIPIDTPFKEALYFINHQKYSRIPITDSSRKEILGVLYVKDLIRAKLQTNAIPPSFNQLMRNPVFVNEETRLNSLFKKFKQQKIHMAIIKNESNKILGLVTMSDLLEALFEDLFPENESLHPSVHPGTPIAKTIHKDPL